MQASSHHHHHHDNCAICKHEFHLFQFRHACPSCHHNVHADCMVCFSLTPERQPNHEENLVSKERVTWCLDCASKHVWQRVDVVQKKRQKIFYTEGEKMSTSMKVTLKMISHFFDYLGLKDGGSTADFRRDREQFVFGLYKKAPSFITGGPDVAVPSSPDVTLVEEEIFPGFTVFCPSRLTLDEAGHASVVLCFHGGAFVMGSHDTPAVVTILRRIAITTGCVCVSSNYRKAPEFLFPCWFEDAQEAYHRIRGGGNGNGNTMWSHGSTNALPAVDGVKVIVMGDSAGGNIACALSHQYRHEVHAQLLLYPLLDCVAFDTPSWTTLGDGHYLLKQSQARQQIPMLFKTPSDAHSPQASPLRDEDFTQLPKTHVLVGAFDPLLDDATNYLHKCRNAGSEATCTVYATSPHGWISFPQESPEQKEALHEIYTVIHNWALQSAEPTKVFPL